MDLTHLKQDHEVIRIHSIVYHCNGCGKWEGRYPLYMSDLGEWHCEKCGCTSVKIREGRPYGPRYRDWDKLVSWFWEYACPEDYETVDFDPPVDVVKELEEVWERDIDEWQSSLKGK